MFYTRRFPKLHKSVWQKLRHYSAKPHLKTYSQKKQHYGNLFPDKMLNKKQATPLCFYTANEEISETIAQYLDPYFNESHCDTILEMNPGPGFFTRKLLDREEKFKKILLMESTDHFINNLQEMHSLYPDRVKVKHADMTSVWKIVYQDKLDNGSRVQELLRDVPQRDHNEDPNMIMFGAVGSYTFFKHLINSIVFQNSILSMGRAEMYFIMPPPIYLHLTCTKDVGYITYRSTTMLFQILYEHQFIARVHRDNFLPAQAEYKSVKNSRLKKILSVHPEFLYVVRMLPRRNIFEFIAKEDLPALWYFIIQNCISRRNRIIPNLEKWIPGCGPRLIINNEKVTTSEPLYPDEDISELPKFSSQCMSISNRDFYPNINIYTQFGDLTPSQLLTLFTVFRSWPEYEDSSFLASFENSMLKNEVSADVTEIPEDDDDSPVTDDEKSENDAPVLDAVPAKSLRKTNEQH